MAPGWLVAAGRAIDRIAAITFTTLAAGELSERVRVGLETRRRLAAASGETSAELLFRQALSDIDGAQISTIHSFCSALLRRFPAEAGVDPGFRPQEQNDDADLAFGRAFDLWLAEMAGGPRPPHGEGLARALRAGVTIGDIRESIFEISKRRELLDAFLSSAEATDPLPLVGEARRLRDELRTILDGQCLDPEDLLAKRLRESLRFSALQFSLDDCDLLFALFRSDDPIPVNLQGGAKGNWRGGKTQVEDLKNRLKALRRKEDIAGGWRVRFDAAVGDWVVGGFRPAIRRFFDLFAQEKHREGILDFSDLLLEARNLLAGPESLRREIAESFDAILVDEFQDTDPVQVEIASLLAGLGRSLRPGALVLVGDPKQSIYRFRRADIESYQSARTELRGNSSAGEVELTTNFRSDPAILAFVNRLFRPLFEKGMAGEGAARQADWVDLDADPARQAAEGKAVAVLVATSDVQEAGEDRDEGGESEAAEPPGARESRLREADEVARRIAAILMSGRTVRQKDGLDRPIRGHDVGILFRALSDVGLYEEALRRHGVAYVIEGGKSFWLRQEVAAVVHTLRAIEAPHEEFTVFAALRSPLFSLTPEALFRARLAGAPFDPTAPDLDRRLAPGDDVGDALRLIRTLRLRRNDQPLAATIESLLEATGIREVLMARASGERALANLETLVALSRRLSLERSATYGEMVDLLGDRLGGKVEEAESPGLDDAADAVRILSIHKAKGLEFPVVFVVDLGRQEPAQSPATLGSRRSDGSRSLEIALGTCRTSGWTAALDREKAAAVAESVRLLYVAATRARDLLVISLMSGSPKKGFLGLLTGAGLFSPLAAGDEAAIGAPFALWSEQGEGVETVRVAGEVAVSGSESPESIESVLAEFEAERAGRMIAVVPVGVIAAPPSSGGLPFGEDLPATDRDEARSDRSRRFGTAVHGVLEEVSLEATPDPDRLAQLAHRIATRELVPDRTAALLEHVGRLVGSPLWKRLLAAPRVHRELPFVWKTPAGSVQEGKVDVLLEENDGLVVIDWKTDSGGVAALSGERRAHYEQQLADYRKALGTVVPGKPVRECLLFFTATGESLPA